MGDQPGPQQEEGLLAAAAEAHDGGALGDGGDDEGDGSDGGQHGDEPDADVARRARPLSIACCNSTGTTTRPVAPTAARLHVQPEALAQHGRLLQAAVDRVGGAEATDGLIHLPAPPPPTTRRPRRRRVAIGLERLDEGAVAGAPLHQVLVAAVVDDPPTGEEHDLVGEGDRRGPGGDHQHRRPGQGAAQVAEHGRLGRRVERRRRVVEQQQRGTSHERPGEGDALALATAEADAALADDGVDAVRGVAHEGVGASQAQRLPQLVVRTGGPRARGCGGSTRRTGTPPGTPRPGRRRRPRCGRRSARAGRRRSRRASSCPIRSARPRPRCARGRSRG